MFIVHYATNVEESGVPAAAVLQKICEHCWSREISPSYTARERYSKKAGLECHLFHAVSFFESTQLPRFGPKQPQLNFSPQ
jgi:hypothetical protein